VVAELVPLRARLTIVEPAISRANRRSVQTADSDFRNKTGTSSAKRKATLSYAAVRLEMSPGSEVGFPDL